MSVERMRYPLDSCVWEITLACCFSCKYCGSSGGRARENELTTEECFSVADQLAELGCARVTVIGGEAFMRPDWDAIVRRLTRQGVLVSIITNGFLFSDEIIARMKAAEVESVAVSVDGPPEIHDRYRQEGSFARAEQTIRRLTEADVPVAVISTLHRENVEALDEFYTYLRQWPLYAWQMQACSPMGNAVSGGVDYRFDFQKGIDFVRRNMYTAPFMMGIADNIGYYTAGEGSLRGNLGGLGFFTGCQAGLTALGIDSVGNVRGCEAMYDKRFIEGNLRERTLRSIWEDPMAFAYNRQFSTELLTGKCGGCEHGAYCAGGCRSYNYFVHGQLYESPFCALSYGP